MPPKQRSYGSFNRVGKISEDCPFGPASIHPSTNRRSVTLSVKRAVEELYLYSWLPRHTKCWSLPCFSCIAWCPAVHKEPGRLAGAPSMEMSLGIGKKSSLAAPVRLTMSRCLHAMSIHAGQSIKEHVVMVTYGPMNHKAGTWLQCQTAIQNTKTGEDIGVCMHFTGMQLAMSIPQAWSNKISQPQPVNRILAQPPDLLSVLATVAKWCKPGSSSAQSPFTGYTCMGFQTRGLNLSLR